MDNTEGVHPIKTTNMEIVPIERPIRQAVLNTRERVRRQALIVAQNSAIAKKKKEEAAKRKLHREQLRASAKKTIDDLVDLFATMDPTLSNTPVLDLAGLMENLSTAQGTGRGKSRKVKKSRK